MNPVPRRRLVLAIVATAAVFAALPILADEPATITPSALAARLTAGEAITVLDVRTPEEFAEGHVPGAVNIPYDQVAQRLAELESSRNTDIVAYCRSGRRTGLALETLKANGFARLLHLQGDLPGWQEAGHPVQATK